MMNIKGAMHHIILAWVAPPPVFLALPRLELLMPKVLPQLDFKMNPPFWNLLPQVGCGDGELSLSLSQYFASVLGVDIDSKHIQEASLEARRRWRQYFYAQCKYLQVTCFIVLLQGCHKCHVWTARCNSNGQSLTFTPIRLCLGEEFYTILWRG